jgi:hypothetical protein
MARGPVQPSAEFPFFLIPFSCQTRVSFFTCFRCRNHARGSFQSSTWFPFFLIHFYSQARVCFLPAPSAVVMPGFPYCVLFEDVVRGIFEARVVDDLPRSNLKQYTNLIKS